MAKKERALKVANEPPARVPKKVYEKELLRLQAELVKVQEWVRDRGSPTGHRLRGT